MVGVGGLTSTTAPGKVFDSRLDLANHYKSDWHKYNLKRREAGMAMLEEEDFNARLEAALALRKEREGRAARTGTDHLKNKKNRKENKHNKKNNNKKNNSNSNEQQQHEQETNTSDTAIPSTTSATEIGNSTASTSPDDVERSQIDESNIANPSSADVNMEEEEEEEEEPPTIDPRQCLFDNHMSASVEKNVDRMYKKYGFFIPDREYLVDLEGLIGYCAEKVKLGHMCLYCQKTFSTWRGCQEHMIDTQHTKLLYERGKDQEEFDVFYDFTEADAEFLGTTKEEARIKHMRANQMIVEEDQADDDSGEWEDVDDDDDDELMDDADDDDDDDGVYGAYKDEIAKHGFDITPMGELVFPDGRIIGHRGLSRYYKQRFTSDGSNRTAVRAARRAAGERLYKGQVYETYQPTAAGGDRSSSALTLAKANISRAGIGGGRMSRGILVPSAGAGGGNSFTALSLYRYKAAVKKSRREEHRGMRLQQRTSLPMNKMDKKANRLMNGVSVAHAAR